MRHYSSIVKSVGWMADNLVDCLIRSLLDFSLIGLFGWLDGLVVGGSVVWLFGGLVVH